MNTPRKLGALIGAGALVLAVSGTAAAVANYATVSSHTAFSAESNAASFWGEDCTKIEDTDLGNVDSYVLLADYGRVIVKAGSGTYANTIFDNPTAGQTVWADTNGDNTFNPGGQDGDKNISHIIFCDESSSSTTTTFSQTEESSTDSQSSSSTVSSSTASSSTASSSSTSFSQTEESTTVTQPPTDTIGSTGSGQQSSGTWLLIAGLGVLLGSIIVLKPSPAKARE